MNGDEQWGGGGLGEGERDQKLEVSSEQTFLITQSLFAATKINDMLILNLTHFTFIC